MNEDYQCKNCSYFFGNEGINCAVHPDGKESEYCSDWQPQNHYLQAEKSMKTDRETKYFSYTKLAGHLLAVGATFLVGYPLYQNIPPAIRANKNYDMYKIKCEIFLKRASNAGTNGVAKEELARGVNWLESKSLTQSFEYKDLKANLGYLEQQPGNLAMPVTIRDSINFNLENVKEKQFKQKAVMEKEQDEVIEALSLVKLKHRLRQKQASVKLPQMPLITIGEISIPNNLESQGLLCVGASKDRLNTSISLIRQLKQRTDFRGIILDRNGELLKRFYDPALDLIFDPKDERSIAWTHKAEAVSGHKLASFLIDIDPVNNTFFHQTAIHVLAGIFDSSNTNEEVWQKLNILLPQDLLIYLPDSSMAANLLHEPSIAPTVASIIKNSTQFYRYLGNNSNFSFHQWINNDDPGWIFIPWFDKNEDDIQFLPLRQMAIELALQGLLEQKGAYHHKSAVVISDLPCVKLNSLPKFAVECCHKLSRKFLFLGSENLSSLAKRCGQQNAQFFLEAMPTKLFMRGWSEGVDNQGYSQTAIANNTSLSVVERNLSSGQRYLVIDSSGTKIKIADENEGDFNSLNKLSF